MNFMIKEMKFKNLKITINVIKLRKQKYLMLFKMPMGGKITFYYYFLL